MFILINYTTKWWIQAAQQKITNNNIIHFGWLLCCHYGPPPPPIARIKSFFSAYSVGCCVFNLSWSATNMSNDCCILIPFSFSPLFLGWLLLIFYCLSIRMTPSTSRLIVALVLWVCMASRGPSLPSGGDMSAPAGRTDTCARPRRWWWPPWWLNCRRRHRRPYPRHSWWCWLDLVSIGWPCGGGRHGCFRSSSSMVTIRDLSLCSFRVM